MRFNTDLLALWAGAIVGQARSDLARLKARGISAPELDKLETKREEVRTLEIEQKMTKAQGLSWTAQQEQTHETALDWWHEAKGMAKVAFEMQPEVLVKFRKGVRVSKSVPLLIGEMGKMIDLFKEYQQDLDSLGGGSVFIKRGKDAFDALIKVNQQQEQAQKAMAPATMKLYQRKAELYIGTRKLVRLGRLEFSKEPDRKAPYDYEIIRRGAGIPKRKDDGQPGGSVPPKP